MRPALERGLLELKNNGKLTRYKKFYWQKENDPCENESNGYPTRGMGKYPINSIRHHIIKELVLLNYATVTKVDANNEPTEITINSLP